jgi:phosphoenolpyruvate-protein phosphotransferase
MAEDPSSAAPPNETRAETRLFGTTVAPGIVLGVVHIRGNELTSAGVRRIPQGAVERELERFHTALVAARNQLAGLKERLHDKVGAEDARIFDTHVALLRDSVFIADVENLILEEQLGLEPAIAKVVSDFDRIFRLVQSDTLRERAVDLRDVGIRVLRQLERSESPAEVDLALPPDYVLVARELSIVDMFNPEGEHVLGILTEEGGLTSHAAILARSMRIPTLTGIEGLLGAVREGDFVIVDASEGHVRVNPDERVREQYREATSEALRAQATRTATGSGVPLWAVEEPRTLDGEAVAVSASCGNLSEVQQARELGMQRIGLYRTELMYLVDKAQPSVDALCQHYAAVLGAADPAPVTVRLLHADSSLELTYLFDHRETNPALGCAGVRALLMHEPVLRRQLEALLRAAAGREDLRIAVPFVTDCADLRRVREIVFEERLALRRANVPRAERVAVGAVVETPAAVFGAEDLARDAEFLTIGLDALLQHLLAADRENGALAGWFDSLHPYVLRALRMVVRAAAEHAKPLSVFGVTAVHAHNLPLLLGTGVRDFCVPPGVLRAFLEELRKQSLGAARRATESAEAANSLGEAEGKLGAYRHGYVRPG